jgi:hypothetical protein
VDIDALERCLYVGAAVGFMSPTGASIWTGSLRDGFVVVAGAVVVAWSPTGVLFPVVLSTMGMTKHTIGTTRNRSASMKFSVLILANLRQNKGDLFCIVSGYLYFLYHIVTYWSISVLCKENLRIRVGFPL